MRRDRLHQTSAPLVFASLFTCSWLAASVSASALLYPRGVDVASASFLYPASRLSARDPLPTPLDNKAYLPAQIGGIVGSYALCLVIVAVTLLLLSKRRREHLQSGQDFDASQPSQVPALQLPETLQLQDSIVPFAVKSPTFGSSNFSYPTALNTNVGYNNTGGSPISATETLGGTIVSSLHAKGNLYLSASYASSFRVPGVDPSVNQEIVSTDREMAQSQLEEMYKYVMEQEEAKANGIVLSDPPAPLSPLSYTSRGSNNNNNNNPYSQQNPGANVGFNNPSTGILGYAAHHRKDESTASSTATLIRKDKTKSKPTSLNLSLGKDKDGKDGSERTSRTSSILSALKSPRNKKKTQGISISSPIMTPMSSTFPRFAPAGGQGGYGGYGDGTGYGEAEEMNTIPPRHYAPAAPPPIPQQQQQQQQQQQPTPDTSPLSTLSIDERIGAALVTKNLPPPRAVTGMTPIDQQQHREPESATSAVSGVSGISGISGISASSTITADSSAPLVGLPTSPKPGVNRFPSLASLPASPRATKTTFFQQPPAAAAGSTSSLQQSQPLSPTGVAFASASPSSGFSRPNAPSPLRTGGGLPLRAYEPSITSPSFATHNQTKQTVFERAAPLSPGGPTTPWTGAPVPYSPYQPFSPVIPMTPSLVTKEDRKRMRRLEPKTPTMAMVPSIDDTW
ncbi:MAG: hypothetical protein STHCBS139747_002599 [Sporothrix thermara]